VLRLISSHRQVPAPPQPRGPSLASQTPPDVFPRLSSSGDDWHATSANRDWILSATSVGLVPMQPPEAHSPCAGTIPGRSVPSTDRWPCHPPTTVMLIPLWPQLEAFLLLSCAPRHGLLLDPKWPSGMLRESIIAALANLPRN